MTGAHFGSQPMWTLSALNSFDGNPPKTETLLVKQYSSRFRWEP